MARQDYRDLTKEQLIELFLERSRIEYGQVANQSQNLSEEECRNSALCAPNSRMMNEILDKLGIPHLDLVPRSKA